MGSMNDFVDANIATLNLLMQEKSKLHMLLEEGRVSSHSIRQETENYSLQLDLLNKDQQITALRNETLLGQTDDLERQVRALCQKTVELSDAYVIVFTDYEVQLREATE
jgi:hypothetical protein